MTAAPDFPVFVLGAPRSGTTLVYSLLLSSGEFPLYEEGETHLLECAAKYGPPGRDRSYRRFLRDWLQSRQFARSGLDADGFESLVIEHRASYVEILRFFMNRMASEQGKARWAEKTPQHVFFMRELATAFPESRFVHVVRDGRDVALSMRRLGWSGTRSRAPLKQLLCASLVWQRYATTCREAGEALGPRYLEIRYEDAVTEPAAAVKLLKGFCHAQITLATVSESGVGALGAGHSAFASRLQGIAKNGLFRWRSLASDREARVMASAVGGALRTFGYSAPEERPHDLNELRTKGSSLTCRTALGFKDLLKRRTVLGRLSPCPLELE